MDGQILNNLVALTKVKFFRKLSDKNLVNSINFQRD